MSKLITLLTPAVNCAAVLICALFCASTCAAQTRTPAQRPDAPPTTAAPTASPSVVTAATPEPDLSITANVTARELLFEVVPTPKVEFPGRPRRDTVWEAERTNLPAQVQPGVTYRDIGIRLKITSVFADIERIVAEALGEIPATDDTAPKTNSNQNDETPADTILPANEAAQPVGAPASTLSMQTAPALSPAQTKRPGDRSGSAKARRGKL